MLSEIVLRTAAPDEALLEKRAALAVVRTQLSERETEFANLRAQLKAFEHRYMAEVGYVYADLDDVQAAIAEQLARCDGTDDAHRLAAEARARADESRNAATEAESAQAEEPGEPAASLKALFRELAKRIHPDLARDPTEQAYHTLLMARANQAYCCGDAQLLERMLADQVEINGAVEDEGSRGEVLRVARQIRHAERDLAALEFELYTLRSSELALLYDDAEFAAREHRDLVAELSTRARTELAEASARLQSLIAEAAERDRASAYA